MKSNYLSYDFAKSRERIDDFLNTSDLSFEEQNSIPSRDKLTYTNGFYVNCTSFFVDIRKSSAMASKYKRSTLARIYKCYISEVVAIMNGNNDCVEICIEGDCVWAVFDTPNRNQIDSVFSIACQISSIIDTLNCKLKKKSIDSITIGIGIDYGRALMIKAGYNGSGINDVVWMGDVVASSSKLGSYGNREWYDKEIMISDVFYSNLNDDNKKLMAPNTYRNCYHGNVVSTYMDDWNTKNCV